MAGMGIRLNPPDFAERIAKLGTAMMPSELALQRAGMLVNRRARINATAGGRITPGKKPFSSGVSPRSKRLKGLTAKEVWEARRNPNRGPKTLRRQSGQLAGSIQTVTETNRVLVGTNIVYGRIHEFGGAFKVFGKYPAEMPARPYLEPAKDESANEILEIFRKDIMGRLEGFGA